MTQDHRITRRTALTALSSTALTAIAGCLDATPPDQPDETTSAGNPEDGLSVEMEGGQLVVELAEDFDADQVNLIQPDGELYGTRDVATGVSQVTFELDTHYHPGNYTILALTDNTTTTTAETTLEIRPNLEIVDIGLYRNHPDKPWDEIYGESETNSLINGEAFVTVKNSGSGPDAVVSLIFTGDVPNPLSNPRGNGIYEEKKVRISAGESIDIYSSSYPFGTTTEDGMGCSTSGNSGEFRVTIRGQVTADTVSEVFQVEYSGSNDMTGCSVNISNH